MNIKLQTVEIAKLMTIHQRNNFQLNNKNNNQTSSRFTLRIQLWVERTMTSRRRWGRKNVKVSRRKRESGRNNRSGRMEISLSIVIRLTTLLLLVLELKRIGEAIIRVRQAIVRTEIKTFSLEINQDLKVKNSIAIECFSSENWWVFVEKFLLRLRLELNSRKMKSFLIKQFSNFSLTSEKVFTFNFSSSFTFPENCSQRNLIHWNPR